MSSPSPASAPARSPQPPPPPAVNTSAPPPPVSTSPPSPPGLPRGALAALVVGIGIGGLIVFVGMCVCVYCYRKRKRNMMEMMAYPPPSSEGPKDAEDPPAGQHLLLEHDIAPSNEKASSWPKPTPPLGIASSHPSLEPNVSLARPPSGLGFTQSTFTYEELRRATNGFSSANLLGQGGYGYVHKGVLSDGKIVAVKQLRAGSGQGEREFRAEVEIISRIHHRHLVSLVGYCISGAQRILVYEFVPNCTMEFHLHGKEAPTLSWPIRLRIALGSARGLAYLHEDCNPKIIHRDIKGSNILLDFSFEAKVADFGLAKLALDTETHVSTRVMGTFGYLAPEYASSGKLTEKSDVYSFGVVLLELITGRRPIDKSQPFAEDSMVDWARPLLASALEGGNFDAIVDPKLQNDYDTNEMTQMIACAAACVRHSARRRPQMSQVVRALEGNLTPSDLTEGIIPGQSQVFRAYKSSDYDSGQYREDLKKFRKMALGSQELATSECSGSTSESGVLPSSSSSGGGHQTTQEMEPEKMEEEKFRRMTLESPEQATSEYSVPSGKPGVLLASSSSGGGHQTTQEMELEKMEEEKVRNLPLESQEQTTTDCSGLTSESGAPLSSSSSGVGHKTTQEVESEKMEEKLRSLALESQEQTTTDCSGPTNESGVPPSSSNSGVGYQTTQGMVSEKTEEVARDAGETSQK